MSKIQNYSTLWETSLNSTFSAEQAPIVIEENIYIRRDNTIYAFEKKSGKIVWEKEFPNAGTKSHIFISLDNLLLTDYYKQIDNVLSYRLYACDLNGETKWDIPLGHSLQEQSFCLKDNQLYFLFLNKKEEKNSIKRLNTKMGKFDFEIKLPYIYPCIYPVKNGLLCYHQIVFTDHPGLLFLNLETKDIKILEADAYIGNIQSNEDYVIWSKTNYTGKKEKILSCFNKELAENIWLKNISNNIFQIDSKKIFYINKKTNQLEISDIKTGETSVSINLSIKKAGTLFLQENLLFVRYRKNRFLIDTNTNQIIAKSDSPLMELNIFTISDKIIYMQTANQLLALKPEITT